MPQQPELIYNMISIHALREEGDNLAWWKENSPKGFQSTPSARRATAGRATRQLPTKYFNPRPPRGERLDSQNTRP